MSIFKVSLKSFNVLKLVWRLLYPLNNEVRRLSLKLKRLVSLDKNARLLMTIPRIGYYTALLIKAEAGDISLFRSGEHLCSYAGLVPLTHSSSGVTRMAVLLLRAVNDLGGE